MRITAIHDAGKGIFLTILFMETVYMLTINDGGRLWTKLVKASDGVQEFAEVKDEKELRKLDRAWKDVVFIPIGS